MSVDEDIMQVLKELETSPTSARVSPLKIDRRRAHVGETASDRARDWVNAQRAKLSHDEAMK